MFQKTLAVTTNRSIYRGETCCYRTIRFLLLTSGCGSDTLTGAGLVSTEKKMRHINYNLFLIALLEVTYFLYMAFNCL